MRLTREPKLYRTMDEKEALYKAYFDKEQQWDVFDKLALWRIIFDREKYDEKYKVEYYADKTYHYSKTGERYWVNYTLKVDGYIFYTRKTDEGVEVRMEWSLVKCEEMCKRNAYYWHDWYKQQEA